MRGRWQRADKRIGFHDVLGNELTDHRAVHTVGDDDPHALDGVLQRTHAVGGIVMRAPGRGVGHVAGHGLGEAVAPAVAVLVNPGVKVIALAGRVGGQRGVLALGHLLAEHDVVFLGPVKEYDVVQLRPPGGIGRVGGHGLGHGGLPAVEAVALAGGLGRGRRNIAGQQAGGSLIVEDHRVLHTVGVGDGEGGVRGLLLPLGGIGHGSSDQLGHGRLPADEFIALALGRTLEGGRRVAREQAGGGLVGEDLLTLHAVGIGDGLVGQQRHHQRRYVGGLPLGGVGHIAGDGGLQRRIPADELGVRVGGILAEGRGGGAAGKVVKALGSEGLAAHAVLVDDGVAGVDLDVGAHAVAGRLQRVGHDVDGGCGLVGADRQQAVLADLGIVAVVVFHGPADTQHGIGGVSGELRVRAGGHGGGLRAVKDGGDGGVLVGAAHQLDGQRAGVLLAVGGLDLGLHDELAVHDLIAADVELAGVLVDPGVVGLGVAHGPLKAGGLLGHVAQARKALDDDGVGAVDVDGGALGGHGQRAADVEGRGDDHVAAGVGGRGGGVGGADLKEVIGQRGRRVAVCRGQGDDGGVLLHIDEGLAAVDAGAPVHLCRVLVGGVLKDGGHLAGHGPRDAGDVIAGDLRAGGRGEGRAVKDVAAFLDRGSRLVVDLDAGADPAVAGLGGEGQAREVLNRGLKVTLGVQLGNGARGGVVPDDGAGADGFGLIVLGDGIAHRGLRGRAGHGSGDLEVGAHGRILLDRARGGGDGAGVGGFARNLQTDGLTLPGGLQGQGIAGSDDRVIDLPGIGDAQGIKRAGGVDAGLEDLSHLRGGAAGVGVASVDEDGRALKLGAAHDRGGRGAADLAGVAVGADGLDLDGLAHVGALDGIDAGVVGIDLGAYGPHEGDEPGLAGGFQRVGREAGLEDVSGHGRVVADGRAAGIDGHAADLLAADDALGSGAFNVAVGVVDAIVAVLVGIGAHLDALAGSADGVAVHRDGFGHGKARAAAFLLPAALAVFDVPLIGGRRGGGREHCGEGVARHGLGVVDGHGGDGGLLDGAIGRGGHGAAVGGRALHGHGDLLAQVGGGHLVAGGGGHHVAIGAPGVVAGRAAGNDGGADHIAHQQGTVLDAQRHGIKLAVAQHVPGGGADGHAAEGLIAGDLELDELAQVALLNGVARLGAHLGPAHAPAVGDGRGGGLDVGGERVAHEGLVLAQGDGGDAAAGDDLVGGVGLRAVVHAGTRHRQGDLPADVGVEHAQGSGLALLDAVHLPAVGHRRVRGRDGGFQHVVHNGRGIVDADGLHSLGGGRGRRRHGDVTAHHVAAHPGDGDIMPLVAIGKNRHGRAGTVKLNPVAARRGAQPYAQPVVADNGAGAHTARLAAGAGAGAGGSKAEELVHHPADGFTDADLRPLGAALLHDDRRAYVVFCHDAISLAGAFAHAYPIAVFADDRRVLLRRGDRGHQPHQRQGDQQDAKEAFHLDIPPLHSVCEAARHMDMACPYSASFWHYTDSEKICKGFRLEIFKFLIHIRKDLVFFRRPPPAGASWAAWAAFHEIKRTGCPHSSQV